jgi:hypothetical protein
MYCTTFLYLFLILCFLFLIHIGVEWLSWAGGKRIGAFTGWGSVIIALAVGINLELGAGTFIPLCTVRLYYYSIIDLSCIS